MGRTNPEWKEGEKETPIVPKRKLTPEEIKKIREEARAEVLREEELGLNEDPEVLEEWERKDRLEHPENYEDEEEETTEETAKETLERDMQKKRILDKIEAQVDLSDFWQTVLSVPAWNDILRIYYRLNMGIVQKFYDSFTVKAILKDNHIEWEYKCYKDGKEILFDVLNEAKVAE